MVKGGCAASNAVEGSAELGVVVRGVPLHEVWVEDVGEVSQYDVGLDDPGLPEVVSGVWGSAFAGVPDVAMLKGRQVRVARVLLEGVILACLLYTSPSPRDLSTSRMPSSA